MDRFSRKPAQTTPSLQRGSDREPLRGAAMRLGCLLVVLSLTATAFAADDDAPLPPFFLAKETTFFSGPLRKDGTVDYVAAINEELGRGVTRENNAAIPLLEA